MTPSASNDEVTQKIPGLLKDQVQLVKRKDSGRYEIAPFTHNLSFEKGFFAVVHACQLLAQKNDGLILMGLAGPSGAGKTVFSEKILNFMPNIAVISMDNYNDASRIIDGNFDDPRLTDYETLLKNIHDLKAGKPVDVPIYDFKTSSRTGYRTLEVPSSRIVIIEGIYALSEKLRPLLDLRVSVRGCVHFDLVKRVLRDIQRAGQEPEEIIQQISETVYPMYKAFIEPDLRTAHIRIVNKFNPFTGFQSPTYILKSKSSLSCLKNIQKVQNRHMTYIFYHLVKIRRPANHILRMRNKDGKYNLMFEEWVTDPPFAISPRITFEVSVRLLGGLMALGYTIAAILKRSSHVFRDERVCVKIDWLEQLNRHYVQALPDDLKTKLSLDDDLVSSPKEPLFRESETRIKNIKSGMSQSYSTHRDKNLSKMNIGFEDRTTDSPSTLANHVGAVTQLSEQISTLNERMDDFTSRIEELSSKLTSSQNIALQGEACNGSAPTSYFITGSVLPNSSSYSQLAKDSSLTDELSSIMRGQRQVMHQLDNICNLLHKCLGERSQHDREGKECQMADTAPVTTSTILASLAIGGLGIFLVKGSLSRN
ncbi:UNVERIFIED_CONTAM: Inorganic pyrophosphatase TTM2 [Sesamum angustifolium]|uniref:Inorganic pyrophosphatase TTM2 n=1 Tax=Sesamum angustifolium TaxID=2727405 RepID=A0AAW2RKU0_9LAMI